MRPLLMPLMFILFCAVFNGSVVRGQNAFPNDSIASADSVLVYQNDVDLALPERHSPGKAAWKSAVVPGWGQAYNKKYWKIPVVYAGLGGLGYWIYFNNDQYGLYKDAFKNRTDDDPATIDEFPIYSDDQLLRLTDFYRRQLDLSVLLTVAWYSLGIIDAVVDAYLFEFDVSDDLSMRIVPGFAPPGFGSSFQALPPPALSIQLNLR